MIDRWLDPKITPNIPDDDIYDDEEDDDWEDDQCYECGEIGEGCVCETD